MFSTGELGGMLRPASPQEQKIALTLTPDERSGVLSPGVPRYSLGIVNGFLVFRYNVRIDDPTLQSVNDAKWRTVAAVSEAKEELGARYGVVKTLGLVLIDNTTPSFRFKADPTSTRNGVVIEASRLNDSGGPVLFSITVSIPTSASVDAISKIVDSVITAGRDLRGKYEKNAETYQHYIAANAKALGMDDVEYQEFAKKYPAVNRIGPEQLSVTMRSLGLSISEYYKTVTALPSIAIRNPDEIEKLKGALGLTTAEMREVIIEHPEVGLLNPNHLLEKLGPSGCHSLGNSLREGRAPLKGIIFPAFLETALEAARRA